MTVKKPTRKPPARKKQTADAPQKTVVHLPDSVLVGPFRFQIRMWSGEEAVLNSALGMCKKVDNEILLKENMNAQTTAEVLLHEVLHSIFYTSGLDHLKDVGEEEEAIVSQLAFGLINLMRHNPKFMPLLAQLLELDK